MYLCLRLQKKNSSIKLIPVKKSDCSFLFDMLKKRDSRVNISHRTVPTYRNHVKFVLSKPYSKWYIIKYQTQKVGTIYLSKQDEIGLFIKNEFQRLCLEKKALQSLIKLNPRDRYLTNINPKNTKSKKFFQKNGFKLIQYTYEFMI